MTFAAPPPASGPGDERIDPDKGRRQAVLRDLHRELRRAQDEGAAWYRWLEDRADGVHQHELRDPDGRDIACPVPGCDALRGSPNPYRPSRAAPRQRERLTSPPASALGLHTST